MQRLAYHIKRIHTDIREHAGPADRLVHDQLLDQVMTSANAEPCVDIPAELHGAGPRQDRPVDDVTMTHLVEGMQIARAVRSLLPTGAGNQRLMLTQSRGASSPLTNNARTLAELRKTNGWHAISTLLVRSGNCEEHAHLALEIARSLGIPAAVMVDNDADHAFVVLYPGTSKSVVVDPWTIFPSSCLLVDTAFKISRRIEPDFSGEVLEDDFNLHHLAQLRERMQQQRGASNFFSILKDSHLQKYGIRSQLLDDMLLEEGVMHYSQLSLPPTDPVHQHETADLEARLSEAILSKVANHLRTTSVITRTNTHVTTEDGELDENQRIHAITHANKAAYRDARNKARMSSETIARSSAATLPTREASATATQVSMSTYRVGPTSMTVRCTATANAQTRPMLWDKRIHGANILYQSPDGRRMSTTWAPQSLIQSVRAAAETASQLGFPERYRQQPIALREPTRREHRLQLLQRCTHYVNNALEELTGAQQTPVSPERFDREMALLHNVDDRYEDLSVPSKKQILTIVANLLPALHPESLDPAVTFWMAWQKSTLPKRSMAQAERTLVGVWQQHLHDADVEPVLRRAVFQVADAGMVFSTVTRGLRSASGELRALVDYRKPGAGEHR